MLKLNLGNWLVLVLALTIFDSEAFAQATRTWVSGVGSDINPCSRTAPCLTFAGAISKTAAGGEISVLDPGGFGSVTITKSITIDGGAGQIAGVLVGVGTNGIFINAGPNDSVTIRNLDIFGAAVGNNGIRINAAGTVQIENCVINSMIQKGIDIEPTTATKVLITDCHIQNNSNGVNGGGVFSKPGVGGSVNLVMDKVRIHNNNFGVRVEDHTTATISNSTITASGSHGVVAVGAANAAVINLDSCIISQNTSSGLRSAQGSATIRFGNCMINNNALGLESVLGGALISYTNNKVGGNTTNGAPSGTITLE